MLAAARLAFDLAIPSEEAGAALFPVTNRNIHYVRRLYEYAVYGFYNVVLPHRGWDVNHGSHLRWPIADATARVAGLMPGMITDIVLNRHQLFNSVGDSQRIVIDTKFTSITTVGQHGNQTFKSENIYQMYAYLRSQEDAGDPLWRTATGVLLYPSIGEDCDEAATVQGHRVRFATVDLAANSQTIRRQLLRIADEEP